MTDNGTLSYLCMKKGEAMRGLKLALATVCCLAFAATAAKAQLFDFEDQSYGTFPSVTSTQGGLTVTIYRLSGEGCDITGPLGPASWSAHSLLDYFGSNTPPRSIANFSAPLSSVSIQFGDYDQDDDTGVLTAFSGLDGTGAVLGTTSLFYPSSKDIANGDSDVATMGIIAPGIRSIMFTSAGSFPDSVYWDNLNVQAGGAAIPEPGSLAMLAGLGVSGWAFMRRRRS
jgi:hypothetical protein